MQLSENGREMRQRETGITNSQLSTDISSIQADKTGTIAGKGDGGEHANKWAVLAILAVGVFMATLDTSIVNISLPTIARILAFH
jgi:hypothetical protein